eukprot:12891853-Prorocentrum_lima.AAC.1
MVDSSADLAAAQTYVQSTPGSSADISWWTQGPPQAATNINPAEGIANAAGSPGQAAGSLHATGGTATADGQP